MTPLKRIVSFTLAAALAACGVTGDGSGETQEAATEETAVVDAGAPAKTYPRPPAPSIDLDRPTRPASSPGRTRCHGILGTLTDPDPAGRIVRAGPSRDAAGLARIPPPTYSEEFDRDWPHEFSIIGSRSGWLEIENVSYHGDGERREVYAGRGWIAAGGVFVGVQSQTGFAEPSHDSAVLITSHSTEVGLDQFGPERIVACSGRWILADWNSEWRYDDVEPQITRLAYRPEAVVSRDPLVLRAWVAGVCNILETTCDGINGNFAESSGFDWDF